MWVRNIQTAGYNGARTVYRTGPKTLLAEALLKKTLQAKVSLKDDRVVTKKLSTRWIWRSQSNRNTIGKVRSLKKKFLDLKNGIKSIKTEGYNGK